MRKFTCILIIFACFLHLCSCKKDAQKTVKTTHDISLNHSLLSFSISGQLIDVSIDTVIHEIHAVVPRSFDLHLLKANFTLANQAIAKVNNTTISTGAAIDFSEPVDFMLVSSDQKSSLTYKVYVETDLQYVGVTGNIIAEKSLNKSYNFYFDQFDGSQYQSINCGPTVATMALKWADSTFAKKPVDARNRIPESGGWWFTSDIQYYLGLDGINSKIDTMDNLAAVVKRHIDNGNLLVLCLDMYGVPQNGIDYQHVQKFYLTSAASWGHFLLVKGYKQTTTNFYLEIYDPYSAMHAYSVITPGQLKGKDRYYVDYSIKFAAAHWWPYVIVVAPMGQVVTSSKFTLNSLHKSIPQARGR